jgi:hypothetical protein
MAAWHVDFTSRPAAIRIFEEGEGPLLTDGTHSCMDSSHVHYATALGGSETGGRRGV